MDGQLWLQSKDAHAGNVSSVRWNIHSQEMGGRNKLLQAKVFVIAQAGQGSRRRRMWAENHRRQSWTVFAFGGNRCHPHNNYYFVPGQMTKLVAGTATDRAHILTNVRPKLPLQVIANPHRAVRPIEGMRPRVIYGSTFESVFGWTANSEST